MSATSLKQESFVASIRTACRKASRIGKKSLKGLHMKKLRKLFHRPQKDLDITIEDTNVQHNRSRVTVHSFLDPAMDVTPASTTGIPRQLTVHDATLAALEQVSPEPVMHSVRFSHPMVGGVASSLPSPATAIVEQYFPVDHYRFFGGEDTPMTDDFPLQVNPTELHRKRAATTSYAETVAALDGVRGFSAMITQPRDHGAYLSQRATQQGRPPTLPCLPYMDPQIPASAFDDPPENEYLSVEEIRQAALDRLNAIATPTPETAVKVAHPISLHPGALVFTKSRSEAAKSKHISAYRPVETMLANDQDDELEQLYASLSPATTPNFPTSISKKRGTRMFEQHQSLLLSPLPAPSDTHSLRTVTPDFPSSMLESNPKNRKSMLQKQYQDLSFTPSAPPSPTSVYSTTTSGKRPTPETPAYGYPGLPTPRYTIPRKGVRQPPLRPKNPSPPPTPPPRSDTVSEFSFSYLQQPQPESIRATTPPSSQSQVPSPPGLSYSSSTTTASSKLPSPAAIAAAKALYFNSPSTSSSGSAPKKRREPGIHELAGIKTGRSARLGLEVGLPGPVAETQADGKGKTRMRGLGWKEIARKVILKQYGDF